VAARLDLDGLEPVIRAGAAVVAPVALITLSAPGPAVLITTRPELIGPLAASFLKTIGLPASRSGRIELPASVPRRPTLPASFKKRTDALPASYTPREELPVGTSS
jgi:hypothetical protein